MSEEQQKEQTGEQIIFTKTVLKGVSKAGRDRVQLLLSEEDTKKLMEDVSKIKTRAKIDIHLYEQEGPRGTFDTAFFFVKEIQDFGTTPGGAYKKASSAVSDTTKSKIESLKGKK